MKQSDDAIRDEQQQIICKLAKPDELSISTKLKLARRYADLQYELMKRDIFTKFDERIVTK